ncbi:MAG: 3-phosphoserine/phosphohydroxythreonine transaminase [Clostridia bacterium]|nr:3-phosphoserine/phosphohydroxythreonine transaminase [Clostridia bacterium]
MRVYNFSAGPSMLPMDVLKKAQAEFLDYEGSGMSITEMSHRGKVFDAVAKKCEALFREVMGISDDYHVLFLQGGASQQFDAIPLNLMKTGKADYIVTGNFSGKAAKEAARYGDVKIVASSKEDNFTYIPKVSYEDFRADADYVHITSNNTIFGTRYAEFPKTPTPLVCDMSSEILSRVVDVNKFGLIYAGAQKNIAPAGLTIVIVRKDLAETSTPNCPTMLKYSTQANAESMYNTPPCFPIYMAMLVLEWIKGLGGVKEIQKINEYKAGLLYDFIDNSSYFTNSVHKDSRSIMNVPFVTPSAESDAEFVKEAANAGLVSLKGHRLVGGMRASIYNAMPVEGVEKLIAFMKDFEMKHK